MPLASAASGPFSAGTTIASRAALARRLGDRQHAGDRPRRSRRGRARRPSPTPRQRLPARAARGAQQRRGDRQVHPRPRLAQAGRREVDDDPPQRELEAAVDQRRPHPLARLAHRGVGQADDREGRAGRGLGERFDDYMRDFLLKEGQPIRPDEVYQEWRKRLGPLGEEDIREMLRELAAWSLEYDQLLHPQRESDADGAQTPATAHRLVEDGSVPVQPVAAPAARRLPPRRTDRGAGHADLPGDRVAVRATLCSRRRPQGRKPAADRAVRRLHQRSRPRRSIRHSACRGRKSAGRTTPTSPTASSATRSISPAIPDQRKLIMEALEDSYEHRTPVRYRPARPAVDHAAAAARGLAGRAGRERRPVLEIDRHAGQFHLGAARSRARSRRGRAQERAAQDDALRSGAGQGLRPRSRAGRRRDRAALAPAGPSGQSRSGRGRRR